jgi:hypothetical protein
MWMATWIVVILLSNRKEVKKHAEAIKRDEEYQKLSFAEKLAKLPEGGAKRQRAKFAEKV